MKWKLPNSNRSPAGADFLALGMANSYQTLSRRILAMHAFQKRSRRQVFAASFGLAVAAFLALLPWRLVAQEAVTPAARKAEANPGAAAAATAAEDAKLAAAETLAYEKQNAELAKKLVGVWQEGLTGACLIVRDDGTFEECPHHLYPLYEKQTVPAGILRGKWWVDGALVLSEPKLGASLRGLPDVPAAQSTGTRIDISRLDDTFLRTTRDGNSVFYRRVNFNAKPPQYDEAVPEGVQAIAKIAKLSPEDAQAASLILSRWMQQFNVDASQIAKIERAAAAQQGRIGFAELFELTDEEAKAYAEVYKLTSGSFKKIQKLAVADQLTPAELSAFKKVEAWRLGWNQFTTAGLNLQSMGRGRGFSEDESSVDRNLATGRIKTLIDQLNIFLNKTVFRS